MHKKIVSFATLISALFFVAVLASCTPEKTADVPPYPDLASLDSEAAMAYPDSTAFDTSTGTFDTSTLTVEQVLDKARLAAAKIVSYKSRGTVMSRRSTSGFKEPIREFSEVASNGDYRSGAEYPDPYDDDVDRSEYRRVGTQSFSFSSYEGWEESSKPRTEPADNPASGYFLWLLGEDDIELRSTNERTEDGVEVYRLVFSEKHEQPVRGGGEYVIVVRTYTLLVSKESFRVVAWFFDTHGEIYAVSSASEIGADTHSRWGKDFGITEYYDFNEPIVIEIPDSYVPWSQPVAAVQTP